jgi:hypothetical protein
MRLSRVSLGRAAPPRSRRPYVAALALAAACTPTPVVVEPALPTTTKPKAEVPILPAMVTPAKLAFMPEGKVALRSLVRLSDGCLAVGVRGERISLGPAAAGNTTVEGCGPMVGAAPPLSAPLLGAHASAGGGLTFYTPTATFGGGPLDAPGALTPTGRVLRLFAETSQGPLLVADAKTLLRPKNGALEELPFPGAPTERVASLVARGDAVLALAMPERLYASPDAGATWSAVDAGHIGAQRIVPTPSGLAVLGSAGHLVWTPARGAPRVGEGLELTTSRPPLAPAAIELPAASHYAARAGVAGFAGARWVELGGGTEASSERQDGGWGAFEPSEDLRTRRLFVGELGGALLPSPLPALSCDGARLTGAPGRVAVACLRDGGKVDLLTAPLEGASEWTKLATTSEEPDLYGLRMTTSLSGATLVVGACFGRGECDPSKAWLLRPGQAPVRARFTAQEVAVVAAMGTSINGKRVFVAGEDRDGRQRLWASMDGGASFSSTLIQASSTDDDAGGEAGGSLYGGLVSLSVGEDGEVTLSLPSASREYAPIVYQFDARGSLVGSSTPLTSIEGGRFEEQYSMTSLGHYGRRLVLLVNDDDQGRAVAYESDDTGQTWNATATSPLVEPMGDAFACGHGGCVLPQSHVRLGWGATEPTAETNPEPAWPPLPSVARLPGRRLSCELAKEPWKRVAADRLPPDDMIAKGKTLWFTRQLEPDGRYLATLADLPAAGAAPKLVEKVLLPKADPRFAQAFSGVQIEGLAMGRVALPKGAAQVSEADGEPMKGLEVSWIHLTEGTSGKVTIPDAGTFGWNFSPFLTMTSNGLTVQPRTDRDQLFLVVNGKPTVSFRAPSNPRFADGEWRRRGRWDYSHVQGVPVASFWTENSQITLAGLTADPRKQQNPSWRYETTSFASSDDGSFDLQLTYLGADPTLELHHAPRGAPMRVVRKRMRSDGSLGPNEEGPTPFDLGAARRACTVKELAAGGRIAFANSWLDLFFEAREVFELTAPTAKGAPNESLPPTLRQVSLVMYGTKTSPCAAAVRAEGYHDGRVWSLVASGDPSAAWVLRRGNDGTTEARPAKCVARP